MLAEDRLEKIVALVNEHGSITATDLMQLLDASESTIRRDLTRLAQMGRIVKVHGGATAVTRTVVSSDQTVYEKYSVHLEEKTAIARFAATLIGPDDFVYIDAGSTTERLGDFITDTRATYFTHSISVAHAAITSPSGSSALTAQRPTRVSPRPRQARRSSRRRPSPRRSARTYCAIPASSRWSRRSRSPTSMTRRS